MQMNSSAQGDTTPVSTETVRVDQKIMADYKAVGGDLSKLHLAASSNQKAVEDNVVDLKSEAEPASNTTDDTKSEIHPVVSSGQQVVEKVSVDSETEITLASNSTEPQDTLAATAEESLPEIHPELIDTSISAEFTGEADSEISPESFGDAAVAVEPKPNVVSENEIPETIAAPILAKEQEPAQQNQAAETDPNSGTEPTLLAAVSEQVAEVNSTAQAEPVRKAESSESTKEADDSDSETAEIVSKAESSSILKEAALDASLTGDDPDLVNKKAKAKEGPEALSNPMVSTLNSTSTTPVEPKSSKSDGSDEAQVIRSVNAPQTAPACQTTKSSAASIASERKMPEIPAEKFVDQVVKSVRLEVGDGRSEMNIRLDPPELGRLHVKLITEAGHVTAGFHAESEGARSLLEASLPALRTALTDSGIQVNHVAVLSGSDFGQLHQQSSEQQSAPKHRGHSSDSNSTTGVEGIQSIDSVTDPNAAVDYFA
jgi:flagellar hook-length control protein FliK